MKTYGIVIVSFLLIFNFSQSAHSVMMHKSAVVSAAENVMAGNGYVLEIRARRPNYNPFPNGIKPRFKCKNIWKKLWLGKGSFYFAISNRGRTCGWSRSSKAKAVAGCEKRRPKSGCSVNVKRIK